jgi:hypothetical protein
MPFADRQPGFVFCLLPFAFCLLPFAFCLLPFAFCLLPFAFCLLLLLLLVFCLLPTPPHAKMVEEMVEEIAVADGRRVQR